MGINQRIKIELISGIIGAIIVAALVDATKASPYWLLIFIPILSLWVAFGSIKHIMQVFFSSGAKSYYKSFPFDEGSLKIWPETQREFLYLGVTASSIKEELRRFLTNEKASNKQYRFMLMDPECDAVREQIAFKKGYDYSKLNNEQNQYIDQEVELVRNEFKAAVSMLKIQAAYTCSPRRLEIRKHNEFIPWWLYMIDQNKIVLGILQRGVETESQPALILEPNKNGFANLFTSVHENTERIWRSSTLV